MAETPPALALSFVIPVFNEEATLRELAAGIAAEAGRLGRDYEIIFVDDGSTDGSPAVLDDLCAGDPRIRLVGFAVNRGKAEALDEGFRRADGAIVITMDADLQDDPAEIPRLVAAIEAGRDLVSGWKRERHDPWHKTIPSRLFNRVVSLTFGIRLHDFNCGFKAYRRDIVKRLHLYGELHRFIPVLAGALGARIGEIPVRHHPRRFGRSKYGWMRLFKGFFDLVTVMVTTRYFKRPLHFFGAIGLFSGGSGGLILVYLAVIWTLGHRPVGNRPLLFYGMLLVILGAQLFSLGVMAELITHATHKAASPALRALRGFPPSDRQP